MRRGLSEQRIRSTCRELLAKNGTVSGRGLREELRTRFGAAGKTERVFRVWREEAAAVAPTVPLGQKMADLKRRLVAAERAAAEHLQRAERAEYREEAHQEHWASEIDRLRQAAQQQPDQAATIRALQSQVLKLTRELGMLRAELEAATGKDKGTHTEVPPEFCGPGDLSSSTRASSAITPSLEQPLSGC